jgi:hypothetical protein
LPEHPLLEMKRNFDNPQSAVRTRQLDQYLFDDVEVVTMKLEISQRIAIVQLEAVRNVLAPEAEHDPEADIDD